MSENTSIDLNTNADMADINVTLETINEIQKDENISVNLVDVISTELPILIKPKIRKRTALVSEYLNMFFRDYLKDNNEELIRWNNIVIQDQLSKFINDNKIKMTNPNKAEDAAKKKLEKTEKRVNKAKVIQQKKVNKQQARPKSAYYFFKLEEQEVIKAENPEFNRKDIHVELQTRWKVVKPTDRGNIYKEIADKAEKEKALTQLPAPKYTPKLQKSAGAPPPKAKKRSAGAPPTKAEKAAKKASRNTDQNIDIKRSTYPPSGGKKDKRIEGFRSFTVPTHSTTENGDNKRSPCIPRFIDYRLQKN